MPAASLAHVDQVEPAPRGAALRRLAEAVRTSAVALDAAASALLLVAEEPTPEPPPPDEDPMLTVAQAAAELQRSPAHVRAQCRRGAIKCLRDGRGFRIRRSALATYERRRTS